MQNALNFQIERGISKHSNQDSPASEYRADTSSDVSFDTEASKLVSNLLGSF